MKAAVLMGKENLEMKEIPVPSIKSDEALVRVKSCGICGTDIHAYHGDFMPHFPLILGHEFSGEIAQIGADIHDFKTGDRVTVSPELYCHSCYNCRRGAEHYCQDWDSIGTTVDGAFAEYIAIRRECLFHLPDSLSWDEGAMLEPAACVYAGIRTIPEYYDKRVMLLGAGSIGLLWLICLRARNPLCIDMVDISDEKLRYAQTLGANAVFNVRNTQGSFSDAVKKKYDVVVDCTGVPSVLQNGFTLLDRDGHFIFFGVAPAKARIEISPYLIYENSFKITGVYPDMRSFGVLIDMMARGIVDFKPLISHRFHLNDFPRAFEFFMNNPDARRKVVITYD